jgi:hypothetical protein
MDAIRVGGYRIGRIEHLVNDPLKPRNGPRIDRFRRRRVLPVNDNACQYVGLVDAQTFIRKRPS